MKLHLDSADCKPVDTIWLWIYYNRIPIYPIFYLLKGDCIPQLQKKQLLKKDCEVAAPHRPGFTVGIFSGGDITRIRGFWGIWKGPPTQI